MSFKKPLLVEEKRQELEKLPFYVPAADSPEMKYLKERREALGGYFPQRPPKAVVFDDADLVAYDQQLRKADVTGVDAQDQAEFHAMMIWIAQSRGYDKAAGWASHKFKDKFGHWPPWGAVPKPMIPSAEIRAWVRSRDIAYAKRKAS